MEFPPEKNIHFLKLKAFGRDVDSEKIASKWHVNI